MGAPYPHEGVYARLGASRIHGVGVFAIRDIPEGTDIFSDGEAEVVWVDAREAEALDPELRRFYEDFCVLKGGKYGCPASFNGLTAAWYMNEPRKGEPPNVVPGEDYVMRADRDIARGEELTVSYRPALRDDAPPERRAGMAARRAAELATGFLVWRGLDYAFDYLLYPFVVWQAGPWLGGAAMSLLSLAACLLLLRAYDRLGRDWIGLEFVRGLRRYDGPSRWRRTLAKALRSSDALAFLLLSVKYDPFVTTAYLRKGAFGGMGRRDWAVFLGSWLVANATWTAACFGGISAIRGVIG